MRRLPALAALMVLVAVAGCGSRQEPAQGGRPEDWVRDQIDNRHQMAEVLEGANQLKDFQKPKLDKKEPSWTDAFVLMHSTMAELKKISDGLDQLMAAVPAGQSHELRERFGKELTAADERLTRAADETLRQQIKLCESMAQIIEKVDNRKTFEKVLPQVVEQQDKAADLRKLLASLPGGHMAELRDRLGKETAAAEDRLAKALEDSTQRLNKELPQLKSPKK